jgi:hypothetical protein
MMAPRIDYPSERTCPPALLAELRRIDPTAELLYVGEGRWILGAVRFNWPVVQKAIGALTKIEAQTATYLTVDYTMDTPAAEVNRNPAERRAAAARQARTLAWCRALIQGFRPIAEYHGDPGGHIVRDFEMRDFIHRALPDLYELLEAEAVGDNAEQAKAKLLLDGLRTKGMDAWRSIMRHKVTALNPGLSQPQFVGAA